MWLYATLYWFVLLSVFQNIGSSMLLSIYLSIDLQAYPLESFGPLSCPS